MTEFINLTPHKIVITDEEGHVVREIEPSGEVLRVSTIQEKVEEVDGIPIYETEYSDIKLPEEKEGVYYIVSSVVLNYLLMRGIDRKDLVAPNTNKTLRDSDGKIIGVVGLQRLKTERSGEKHVSG